MKQAWWKNAWSHFSEIRLEGVDSHINEGLEIFLSKGRYQLCVKNAIYSFGDKYDNFWDVFNQMNIQEVEGKRILILGFGLGSIPYMLEKMGIKAQFTGVELDEAVVYLYNKYVADEIKSHVEIVISDAYQFMKMNSQKYDIIAMDVFIEDVIPPKFLEHDFINSIKNSLAPDGLLIWNFLYHFAKDRDFADQFFKDRFGQIFENASFLQTRGNKMLLNKKIVNSQAK